MKKPSVSNADRAEGESGAHVGRAFRRGSSEAVEEVRGRVRRIVSFRGYRMSVDDRRDLEQEIMTQIWQAVNRSGFEAGDRFWGFVEVVTARRCIDWLRGRGTRNRETTLNDSLEDGQRGPLGSALDRERVSVARAAVAELGGSCQQLLNLHFAGGKSYRELSEMLGKSEGALRVQVHRCITRARGIVLRMQAETGNEAREER